MGVKNKMTIRKATSYETQKILDHSPVVMQESSMGFIKGRSTNNLQMVLQILADGGYYLLASEEDNIQGWIGVGQSYNIYTNRMEGLISELYVLPQSRNKGVAQKLIDKAIVRLRKSGFEKVQLNVYSGNPAKRLYEKHQFYDVSTIMKKDI